MHTNVQYTSLQSTFLIEKWDEPSEINWMENFEWLCMPILVLVAIYVVYLLNFHILEGALKSLRN